MWVEFKTVNNLITAEMWKEFFEAEGIPTRILPEGSGVGEKAKYRVLVPKLKKHLIEDILRKV
ncbi:MAG TPA: hypothetical protein VMW64_09440 [Dehalococcoidia bacterium]|nr:hypothetical protein [Dehalococcoidia bacterium]